MYKGLFIHVPKTGGTSMDEAFKPFNESQIITERTSLFKKGYSRINHSDLYNFKVSKTDVAKHIVGNQVWSSVFTFAFVRNPWDRYVSNWKWLTRRENTYPRKGWHSRGWNGEDGKISFENFVKQTEKIYSWETPFYQHDKWHLWNQVTHLKNKEGIIELDFVGRFEKIKEDFDFVCKNLDIVVELPHLNHVGFYEGEVLKKQPHYSSYYTQELIDIVAKRCMPDIKQFNYDFEKVE